MADPTPGPSPLAFWLEEALTSWIVPVAALVVVGITAALYLAGLVSEPATAGLVVVTAPLLAALVMVRPALGTPRPASARALVWGAALATFAVAAAPAFHAIVPGEPTFKGDLGVEGESIPVPPGVSGPVELLVTGRLPQSGEPTVTFVLTGAKEPVEGKFERVYGTARVGRMGRTRTQHDHDSDWYPAVLPQGTTELKLDRVAGHLGGRIQVEVFRDIFPRTLVVLLSIAVLVLAAIADARLALQGNVTLLSGMALAFGLLITFNATPSSAVGPAIGGVLLGAICGAVAGGTAGWIAKKLVPPARKKAGSKPGKSNGAAAA